MLTLPRTLTLTPSQFAEVCAANPEAVLELAADGTLIEVTPTGGSTGARNQTLGALLWLAIEQSRLPLKLFDSSAGFLLPVAARLLRRSWLRTQPRRKRRAAGSLAGVERGRTGWFPAPLPRSGGGAGQPFRWAAGPAPQDGRLHGQWSQFGLAVAAAKPHGGGVEGRGTLSDQELTLGDAWLEVFQQVLPRNQFCAAGKLVARAYREEFGEEPPRRQQFVDGAPRQVKSYRRSWLIDTLKRFRAQLTGG